MNTFIIKQYGGLVMKLKNTSLTHIGSWVNKKVRMNNQINTITKDLCNDQINKYHTRTFVINDHDYRI